MYVGSRRGRVAERPSDRVADAIGTATKNHKESNEYNHRHGKGLCKLKKIKRCAADKHGQVQTHAQLINLITWRGNQCSWFDGLGTYCSYTKLLLPTFADAKSYTQPQKN